LESPKARSYDALPQEDPWEKLSRQGSLNVKSLSSNLLNQDNGNVHLPNGNVNGSPGSFYSIVDSNGNSRSPSNNHLLPPQCIMGTSVMTIPPQYSASVRTIAEEYESTSVPGWAQSLSNMFDLSLLTNKAFMLYAFTSFLNMLGECFFF